AAGTASTLSQIQYSTKGNPKSINQVNPGVFFFYDEVVPSSSTITVTESAINGWTRVIQAATPYSTQITLYTTNCVKVTSGTFNPATGTATISGVTAGNTYIVGIKYDPGSLVGYVPPAPTTTYTFTSSSSASGKSASVNVVPK